MNLLECVFDRIVTRRVNWRVNPPYSLERKTSASPIFAYADDVAVPTLRDQYEPFSTSANAYDATRLHSFIQPAQHHFGASVWLGLMESGAGTYEALKAQNS